MGKSKLHAIFWDNDGVLVDTESLYFLATHNVLKSIGFELTEPLFITHFLERSSGLNSLLAEFEQSIVDSVREERNVLYSQYLESRNVLIDGVNQVLNELSAKYRLAIVTSSRREHFEKMHAKTDILHHFEFILTSKDYLHEKPDPAPYLKALHVSKLAPTQCLVIEDSQRGISSAKSAGIPCCAVKSTFTKLDSIFDCNFKINQIVDLPFVIREHYL